MEEQLKNPILNLTKSHLIFLMRTTTQPKLRMEDGSNQPQDSPISLEVLNFQGEIKNMMKRLLFIG